MNHEAVTIAEVPPGPPKLGRKHVQTSSWLDDPLVALSIAVDKARREHPECTLAGWRYERMPIAPGLDLPERAPVLYILYAYFDPPNAEVDPRNPRNLNEAPQVAFGTTLSNVLTDNALGDIGLKERKF